MNRNKQIVNSGFESNAEVQESGPQFVSGQSVVGGKRNHGNKFNKQHQQIVQQESNVELFGQSEQVTTGQRFGKKNHFNHAVNSQSVESGVLVNNQGASVVTGSIQNNAAFASKNRVNQASTSGKAVLIAGNVDNSQFEASRFESKTGSKFANQAELQGQVAHSQESKIVTGQKFSNKQFQSNFNQASKVVSGSTVVSGQEVVSGQRNNQVVSGSQVNSNVQSIGQSEQGSVVSGQRFDQMNTNVNKATATLVTGESTVSSNRNSVVGSQVDQVQSEVVSGQKVFNRNQQQFVNQKTNVQGSTGFGSEAVSGQTGFSNKFNQAVNVGVIGSQIRNQEQFVNQKTNVQGSTGFGSSQVEAEESVVGQRFNKLNKINQAASVVSESQVAGSQFVSGQKQVNRNKQIVNSGFESNAEVQQSGSQFVSGQKQVNNNRFNKQHQQQVVEDSTVESVGQSEQGSAFSGQRFANKNTVNKVVSQVNTGFESNAEVQESGSHFVSGEKRTHGNKFNKQHQQVVQQQSNVQSFGQSEQVTGQQIASMNTVNKASAAVVNSGFESVVQPTAEQVQEIGSQFFSRQNNAIKTNKVNQQVVNSGIVESSVVGQSFIKNNKNQVASMQSNSNSNWVNSVVSEAQPGFVAGERAFENKLNLASINTGSVESVGQHGQHSVMHASVKSGSFGHGQFGAKHSASQSQASFISEVSPKGFAKLDAGNFF